MRSLLALPLGIVLAGFGATTAFADAISANTILQDFNAVIYSGASTSADIEGAAVVGGNFSGATMYNNPTSGVPSGYGALTVYGNNNGGNLNINNGGSAYIGGTNNGKINFNGGGGFYTAPPNTISDFETSINTLSTSLSQLSSTSALPTLGANNNNNILFTATAAANGVAVFNITAAQLASISSFSINLNGASTVVFNVSGASVTDTANDESGVTGANNIIWNFYQATSVNLGTQIAGTVLAPDANVTNGNQIDGDLIAYSWTGSGELHDYGFEGVLPTDGGTPVPEPASLALLIGGIAAFGLLRRRHPA